MNYRASDQSIDEHIPEYVLLRTQAESKMEMGAGAPKQFSPILRMSYAGLPRRELPWATASCRESLKFGGIRRTSGDYLGRAGEVVDKMLCLRKRQRSSARATRTWTLWRRTGKMGGQDKDGRAPQTWWR